MTVKGVAEATLIKYPLLLAGLVLFLLGIIDNINLPSGPISWTIDHKIRGILKITGPALFIFGLISSIISSISSWKREKQKMGINENSQGFHSDKTLNETQKIKYNLNANNTTLKTILEHFENEVTGIRTESNLGRFYCPAQDYPRILAALQQNTKECIVSAIAVLDRDERFWIGYWGDKIADSSNRKSKRIFIVSDPGQLYNLKDKLAKHSENYAVYAINKIELQSSIRDFSIINSEVVAYYEEKVDPDVDKKINFETNKDIVLAHMKYFEKIESKAKIFSPQIYNDNFQKYVDIVFGNREISNYINLKEYDSYEPHHEYYQEMQEEILKRINDFLKRNEHVNLLEIGPGTGLLTKQYCSMKTFSSIELVEYDLDCVDWLNNLKNGHGFSFEVRHIDICSFKPNKKYDLIVSSFANHHIEYSKNHIYYKRVFELLAPNGIFLFGEEYIPEFNDGDEYSRVASLFTYHNHIITKAIEKKKFITAKLETISLIKGVEKNGEYKISKNMAENEMRRANLSPEFIKIGPNTNNENWGVFFCEAKHKTDPSIKI